jgi:hypothetical protein
MTMIKRGRVLRDTSHGEGLVFIEGTQYSFRLEGMWRSEFAPSVNMPVEATFDEQGQLVSLISVPLATLGREQAVHVFDAAGNAVQVLTTELQAKGLPFAKVWAQRAGYDTIGAALLLIVAWFWLPVATLGLGILGNSSLSLYEVLGYLNGGFLGLARGRAGFYGFLLFGALAGIFLPQLWKDRRAYYAMSLPLGLTLLVVMRAYQHAFVLGGASAWNALSFGSGLYLALAAACYLTWRGLHAARGCAAPALLRMFGAEPEAAAEGRGAEAGARGRETQQGSERA